LQPLQDNFVIEKVKNAAAGTTAFRNQYASIYFSRLMALKKRVRENAERKWRDVGACGLSGRQERPVRLN
jgi:hypothetical protein